MSEPSVEQQRASSRLGTVALLESVADRRRAVRAFLEDEGFDVLLVEGADEAEVVVDQRRAQLLLLGGEFARMELGSPVTRVRRRRHGGVLPIVLMPDHTASPADVATAAADIVLPAPFQMGQLARVIAGLRNDGEFRRPPPDSPFDPDVLTTPLSIPLSGTLDDTRFADVFRSLWQSAFTGIIALKAGSTWRRIDLANGFPVATRSNLLTEHLLRYLLRLGYVSPEDYRRLLPTAQDDDWEGALAGLADGPVDPARLTTAREKLAIEIVLQCFRWREAAYRIKVATPEPNSEPIPLNPFSLYAFWLGDPPESTALREAFQKVRTKALAATPAFKEHHHLVQPLLEPIAPDQARFDGSLTGGRLAELLGDHDRARAAVVALVELGVLLPASAANLVPRSPTPARKTSRGRKFDRIRQMVAEDQNRITGTQSPYAAFGLADGAAVKEVRTQYQRFCRFYRPENFERIGDPDLVRAAEQLLEAFEEAATEILGEPPQGPPMAPAQRSSTKTSLSQDDQVLAEAFFDDGMTYQRLGDWSEAREHFGRADELCQGTPRYLTYLGWSTFHLGATEPDNVRQARDLLLSALKIDARNDRALYYLGCIYEKAGRIDRAIASWKKALRVNSANFDARAALRRVSST